MARGGVGLEPHCLALFQCHSLSSEPLHFCQTQTAPLRQLERILHGRSLQFVIGSDAIDQPDGEGLVGAQPAGAEHDVEGTPQSDDARQSLATAPSWNQAVLGVLVADTGALGREYDISSQHQLGAAREA